MKNKCTCKHHWVSMLVMVLTWISAVLFLWSAWSGNVVWNFGPDGWFTHTVVFALIGITMSKGCNCCCGRACCEVCPVDGKKEM